MIEDSRIEYYYWRAMANNSKNSFSRAITDYTKAI
jgi:hypothetical protein